ncbi:MAG: protein kinase, partial [bacterium]|nr:protein kinase [bacterium]
QNIKGIFLGAIRIDDSVARSVYLDERCGGNRVLRARLEAMLLARRAGENGPLDKALQQLTDDASVTVPNALDSLTGIELGAMVGPYKIRELLAEGGMGVVYIAEQAKPVRRKVALKVIKPGMASKDALARFEAERQALALMDHPSISRIFDGGVTDRGLPYFVMELVRGTPISEFCDEQQLSVKQRLEIMLEVCLAVQHAHQKGVIHRDIKPSNVLVSEIDGRIVPKVIDFGVAKAVDQKLSEETIYTQFSQLVGTPLYMSPEQAGLGVIDIDTSSDVYSLGVLLYEVITGRPPFDKSTLKEVGIDEFRRLVREVEPSRPSAMVSTLRGDNLTTVANDRRCSPARLREGLKGDLDWIVMKALEKDRSRRYESASHLAKDIQAFLSGEPVEAHPPSNFYRLKKLARRHWQPLAALLMVICTIAVGGLASAFWAIRATIAESKAEEAEEIARARAEDTRALFYASDVALANQDWRRGDVQSARGRLIRHIPTGGEKDLRGFEWHFLWKQQQVTGTEVASTGAAIYDIEFSPDQSMFAVAGADGWIRAFRSDKLEACWEIDTQQGETNGLAFSPDGQRIAACGDDGTLKVWALDNQQLVFSVDAHPGLAFQVAFVPGTDLLVTCGDDPTVRVWNADTGEAQGSLNEHEAALETLSVSPEGLVAAADSNSEISVWDLTTRSLRSHYRNIRADSISSVQFSHLGDLAQATVDGLLTVRDFRDGVWAYKRRLPDGIRSIAFSSNGLSIVVGDQTGNLRIVPVEKDVWDTPTTLEWAGHEGRVYALATAKDGYRVLSGGADGRVMCWYPYDESSVRHIKLDMPAWCLAMAGAERIAIGGRGNVSVYDFQGRVLHRWEQASSNWDVAFADEANLLVGTSDTSVLGWDLESGKERFSWESPHEFSLGNLKVSPDGRLVFFVARYADGRKELRCLTTSSLSEKLLFRLRSGLAMDMSPEGNWLAFDSDNEICILDTKTLEVVQSWKAHDASIRDIRFGSQGLLGTVSLDRTVKLWSMPQGEMIYSALAHRTNALRLAISPNQSRIATGGYDRMLRLWDGHSDQACWEYPLVAGQVLDLDFSQDGNRLISICNQHELLILDATPGR